MARIRTVKPEFHKDEDMSSVSIEAAYLAIGLLNIADDEGYFNANPKLIECEIFPLRELSGTCTVLLKELSSIGYISTFKGSDGKTYGRVTNFAKHQVINKKKASKIKELIIDEVSVPDEYRTNTVAVHPGKERKGRERKGMDQGNVARSRKSSWVAPEWIDVDAWQEFEQHRKQIRKPLSDLARTKAANQLKELTSEQQREVIDRSIQSGWPGLYPQKAKAKPANDSFTEKTYVGTPDEEIDWLRD